MAEVSLKYPHLEFEQPSSHYFVNEQFAVVMLPAEGGEFEAFVTPQAKSSHSPLRMVGNRILLNTALPPGHYFLKARWRANDQNSWTAWSPGLGFTIHEGGEELSAHRERDHRLSLMLEKGVGGAITLIDPEAEPPGAVGLSAPKWFATPVYEGATPLMNEDPDYYRDPLAYYVDCIDQLVASGAIFLTWHDVLDGGSARAPLKILLQFDVDGGPRSMRRIYVELVKRGIRASLMVHRRGHHWYPYELGDDDVEWIKDAESRGWAVGYHNNALSQIVGGGSGGIHPAILDQAIRVFSDDVRTLKQQFNIRTFTHHGGNIYNLNVATPEGLDIIGVDRGVSPWLWESVQTMFSDGGFIARPTSLREKVASLKAGFHFFRNHPFKYGNYASPADVPPRFKGDLRKLGLVADKEVLDWQSRELEKETNWLNQRQLLRSPLRLSNLRVEKPISRAFSPYRKVEERISELRKNRRASFLRLYPWVEGDPRVFWWRMLEAWAPKSGQLLSVGAMPPDQKNELNQFLSPDVALKEMDIDSERCPDYLIDVCDAPASMNGRFAGLLLFGLPYFASPSEAVAACARLSAPKGIGLFGFVASTHPARGSVFHPFTRHLWRKEKEPLGDLGLRGNLWAFDHEGVLALFRDWESVRIESMGHYWFVVGRKR